MVKQIFRASNKRSRYRGFDSQPGIAVG